VIHVSQFKEAMDANGRLRGSVGNSPYRLHQVRGHYKTYTQEAPLFGKLTAFSGANSSEANKVRALSNIDMRSISSRHSSLELQPCWNGYRGVKA